MLFPCYPCINLIIQMRVWNVSSRNIFSLIYMWVCMCVCVCRCVESAIHFFFWLRMVYIILFFLLIRIFTGFINTAFYFISSFPFSLFPTRKKKKSLWCFFFISNFNLCVWHQFFPFFVVLSVCVIRIAFCLCMPA